MMHVEIVDGPIDTEYALDRLSVLNSGAVVIFSGVVRPTEGIHRIERLHYEHYPEMAGKKIKEIAKETAEKHRLKDVVVLHRFGDVPVGETSVVVAVCSERRKDAFAGCSEIIDRVKQEAPIWKKDIGERTQWQSERR